MTSPSPRNAGIAAVTRKRRRWASRTARLAAAHTERGTANLVTGSKRARWDIMKSAILPDILVFVA